MEQQQEATQRVEVLDSMLDWELMFDSRLDADDRALDDLEKELKLSDKVYSPEEEQKIVVLLLQNMMQPEQAEKALRCLCIFIRHKLLEPILVGAIADQLYDYFVSPEQSDLAFNALKTIITEMPAIDIVWDKDSRPIQLALKLVESLAPRLAGGITKANVSRSLELMAMLLRHFGTIMRNHAKLCNMRFLGSYFCTGVELGRGSYANVFLGRHTKTAEVVAIKAMDWDRLTKGKDKLRQALENEIRIMSESDHPNIVRLYDSLREGCNLNLILEYCGGGSLEEYLLKKGPLPEEEVLHWLHELALGLKFLHDRNIVHRDIKPGNLLLYSDSAESSLKITDFTFARFLDPGDLATTLVGTPLYMAPEIFQDQKYTEKGDLWSVGVLLYQMLTGTVPYRGNNIIELLTDIKTSELRWPTTVKISANMKDLILSLLQKNADLRISWTEFFMHPCVGIIVTETEEEEEPMDLTMSIKRSVLVNEDLSGTLKALRAELDSKNKELKEVKEELTITQEKLTNTQEDVEELTSRLLHTESAKERAEQNAAQLAEEKKLAEEKVLALKHQLLEIAANRILKESSNSDEEDTLRNENAKLLETVETLTKELEVYKIALQLEAADAGLKEGWRKYFN